MLQMSRKTCAEMDHVDPLAFARARFSLPEGVVYLDGNSLGALPANTATHLANAVETEWGRGLIRSWNQADWITLPQKVGAKIATLIGARSDEVIAADSTSINIFKLLTGALTLARAADPSRRVILSEAGNFPTDLYIAEGINSLFRGHFTTRLVDAAALESSIDGSVAVALLTEVDYRTGHLHDMARLNAHAKKNGSRILWDLSHSAGAVPVKLNDSGAELAVGCGYKYLNGGPGAPAYAYVAKSLQAAFPTPLSGWFGHAAPFDFATSFKPAAGITRLQCGTPSILAMQALDAGLDTFADIDMAALREKSLALSDLFWQLMDQHCREFGFACISPREHDRRGSQLSFTHEHAYAVTQAIIDRGVIGDFRQPNVLRFGFTPLYLRHTDIWDAVMIIRDVMLAGAWQTDRYLHRQKVT